MKVTHVFSFAFCFLGLLNGSAARGQVTKEQLDEIGAKLEAARSVYDRMPAQSRRMLSSGARNFFHLAENWPNVRERILASHAEPDQIPLPFEIPQMPFETTQTTQTISPGISAVSFTPPVRVSNLVTDFAFGPTSGFQQSETSTAWCGSNIVVGFNDSGSFWESIVASSPLSLNGVALSANQGATFTDEGSLPAGTSGNFLLGDPVLGCGNSSTFYYSSLLVTSTASAVSVSKSTNGGATFGPPVVAVGKNPFTHFLDKDFMAVNPSNPSQIAVTYTDFDFSGALCGSGNLRTGIEKVFSADGGATWSPPAVIDEQCNVAPNFPSDQDSQVTFGAAGEVYVAWENYSGGDPTGRAIFIRKAPSLGLPYLSAVKVSDVHPIGDGFTVEGGIRTFIDLGQTAVDRSPTPTKGTVYVVWHDGRRFSKSFSGFLYSYSDIWISKSTDGGATWQAPVRVNSNALPLSNGFGTDAYQPSVAVDGTGKVGVCFYDRRADSLNYKVNRSCATSTNGGGTFSNAKVTTVANWPPIHATDDLINGFYLGDYDGVTSDATLATPGFISSFNIVEPEGTSTGVKVFVPNSNVWATKFN